MLEFFGVIRVLNFTQNIFKIFKTYFYCKGKCYTNLFYIYADKREIVLTNDCTGPSHDVPMQKTLQCEQEFQLNDKMSFKHNDT